MSRGLLAFQRQDFLFKAICMVGHFIHTTSVTLVMYVPRLIKQTSPKSLIMSLMDFTDLLIGLIILFIFKPDPHIYIYIYIYNISLKVH